MRDPIALIGQGLPVGPIHWALMQHPELWNEHDLRTRDPESPHHGLDDIWCRYAEPGANPGPDSMRWYPSAEILGVRPMCLDLMRHVGGVELGGVLITRIPPGKECKPHVDPGWHADRYSKFGVQIASAPDQRFCFDSVSLETKPGDLFTFDNSFRHWVKNPTTYERITMIVAIRVEN